MIHPSYVELMKVVNDDVVIGEEPVVNSRYSIVCATAKRARQIIDGQDVLVPYKNGEKPLSIAVKELYSSELKILTDEEALEEEKLLNERIAIATAQKEAFIAAQEAALKEEEAAEAAKNATQENESETEEITEETDSNIE